MPTKAAAAGSSPVVNLGCSASWMAYGEYGDTIFTIRHLNNDGEIGTPSNTRMKLNTRYRVSRVHESSRAAAALKTARHWERC